MFRPYQFPALGLAAAAAAMIAAPAMADLTWNSTFNATTSGSTAADGVSMFGNGKANWTDSTTGLAYTGTITAATAANKALTINSGYINSAQAASLGGSLYLGSTGSLTVTGGFMRFVSANFSSVVNNISNAGASDATGHPIVSISGGQVRCNAVQDVAVTLSGTGSLWLGGNSSVANNASDPIAYTATVNITSEGASLIFARKLGSTVIADHITAASEILIDGVAPVLGSDPATWEPGDTCVITTTTTNQYANLSTVRKQTAAYGSCVASGGCTITYQASCAGAWTDGGSCAGSCTLAGVCTPVTNSASCSSGTYTLAGTCAPMLFQPTDPGFENAAFGTVYGNGTTGFSGTAALNSQISTWYNGDDFASQVVLADGTTVPNTINSGGSKWGRLSLSLNSTNTGGIWTRIGNYDPAHGAYSIAMDVGDRLSTTFSGVSLLLVAGNFEPMDNITTQELLGTAVCANTTTAEASITWSSSTTTAARTGSISVTLPVVVASGIPPQSGDELWLYVYNNSAAANVALVDNVAILGSCCDVNAACTMTRQSACISPSTWNINTACVTSPCTLVTGECCVANDCSVTSQAGCAGVWSVGGSCNPGPCSAPTGNCCIAGNCTISVQSTCAGSWTLNGSCSPNLCTAACCTGLGACSAMTQDDCAAAAGMWSQSVATCNPNPCPQVIAKCCNNSTGACVLLFSGSCASGTTQSSGTTCDAGACPITHNCCDNISGACSLIYGGSCASGTTQNSANTCDVNACPVIRVCCNNTSGLCAPMYGGTACASGTTVGVGTTCDVGSCDIVFGACCQQGGACILMTSASCSALANPGTHLGTGVACTGGLCFGELEPNSHGKESAANNPAVLASGDAIAGIATGGGFDSNDNPNGAASNGFVDMWLVSTAAAPLGIYRHEMNQIQGSSGQGYDLRGNGQNLGVSVSANLGLQSKAGTSRTTAWYGFGKQERIVIEAYSGTTTPYVYKLTDTPVTPTVSTGTVGAGPVTIRVVSTDATPIDSDTWLYDGNFNALTNDATAGPGGADGQLASNDPFGTTTSFIRTLAPGTYYLAVSPANLANDQPNDPAEGIVATGGSATQFLADYPDIVICSKMGQTTPYTCHVELTDASGTVVSPDLTWPATTWNGVINFVQFTVVAGGPTGVCCRGSTCNTSVAQADCTPSGTAGATFAASATCNSGTVSNSPCCYADYNKTNGVNVQDIFDFLSGWFAGSPYAKVGSDGTSGALTVQSIFDFLSNWFTGGC